MSREAGRLHEFIDDPLKEYQLHKSNLIFFIWVTVHHTVARKVNLNKEVGTVHPSHANTEFIYCI